MTFLLDVNVLIALVDSEHVHHESAHRWFEQTGQASWATCPMTENALLRILGNSRYPQSLGTPAAALSFLTSLRALPGHVFWPDDISFSGNAQIDASRLLGHGQVTDTYLLALASAHGAKLASFDRRLVVDAVRGGAQALHLI